MKWLIHTLFFLLIGLLSQQQSEAKQLYEDFPAEKSVMKHAPQKSGAALLNQVRLAFSAVNEPSSPPFLLLFLAVTLPLLTKRATLCACRIQLEHLKHQKLKRLLYPFHFFY